LNLPDRTTPDQTKFGSFNLPISGWQKVLARLILGMELAGEVESVGKKVTRFKPGNPIFTSTFAVNFGGQCPPSSLTVQKQPRTTFVISGTISQDLASLVKKGKK